MISGVGAGNAGGANAFVISPIALDSSDQILVTALVTAGMCDSYGDAGTIVLQAKGIDSLIPVVVIVATRLKNAMDLFSSVENSQGHR